MTASLSDNTYYTLKNRWSIPVPDLVRTFFFDPQDSSNGYVVSYSEKKQKYILRKIHLGTGKVNWETTVVNGGYGTPVIYKNLVVMLRSFDSIVAINKETGKEIFFLDYNNRIRTSLNRFDGLVWFGHTSHLVGINEYGKEMADYYIPGAFLYGTISSYQDTLICIGTKFNDENNESNKYVWVLQKETKEILFEVNLGKGSVISTDTSGFWLDHQYIYTANDDNIFKIDISTGKIIWKVRTEGDADRQLPVADEKQVYYTTLSGYIESVDKENGQKKWSKKTGEKLIVTPPTVIGRTLLVGADASLLMLDKRNGRTFGKTDTGHSPYSAATYFYGRVYIGAGEPPVHGLILAYDLQKGKYEHDEIVQSYTTNNTLDSKTLEVVITTNGSWDQASIDPSVISTKENVTAKRMLPHVFNFLIDLNPKNVEGLYALPVALQKENKTKTEIITVELKRVVPLPAKTKINKFNKLVEQENAFTSGAALTQLVEKQYGKKISQKDFREIIDYVKEQSNWEDADFQTWRLILKRVLSTPAKNLKEFKEEEQKHLGSKNSN
ncbi:PQQ-binding-like beta-propeller repeat protein [Liquorilactobacillus ghanensis]|uniref:outer membrane protein assembly factor BamB family protein n=1 Tax=Liquorilactobacillus ghanensis TaxID=399370 RepID=UPI0039E72F92